MDITLTIPDETAGALAGENGDPARSLLELAANDAFLRGRVSERQVQVLLGLETRFAVHDFLKASQDEMDAQADAELATYKDEFARLDERLASAKVERSV